MLPLNRRPRQNRAAATAREPATHERGSEDCGSAPLPIESLRIEVAAGPPAALAGRQVQTGQARHRQVEPMTASDRARDASRHSVVFRSRSFMTLQAAVELREPRGRDTRNHRANESGRPQKKNFQSIHGLMPHREPIKGRLCGVQSFAPIRYSVQRRNPGLKG